MRLRSVIQLTLVFVPASLHSGCDPPHAVGREDQRRAAIVEQICSDLERIYVLPEDARSMVDLLRANQQRGEYDHLSSLEDFTARLTEDLRSIHPDPHLEISVIDRTPQPEEQGFDHRDPEYQRRRNYLVRSVEVLDGNVGYLALDGFASSDGAGIAGAAALNFLAHTDALIIDLRANTGGGPEMIQLLMSYLGERPQQLSSIHIRESNTDMQLWTQAFVSGPRLAEIPVWVLVSEHTFSAAEAFAYDMKHMGRGTIVGEVTRGGAHLARTAEYPELGIALRIPFARAVSPVTGGNWEGVGVQPDVPVAADQALATAHAEAVRLLLSRERDRKWRLWLKRALEEIEAGETTLH